MRVLLIFAFLGVLFSQCSKPNSETPNYAPTLTTATATNITPTSATLGGTITDEGSSVVIERGVCWSITPNPNLNSAVAYSAGNGSPFSFIITTLAPSTTYYVRAFAKNNNHTGFGPEVSFTTLAASASLPVLTTTAVSAITSSAASSGGNISSDGGAAVTARGVCWNTSTGPTIANNLTTNGTGTGSFISAMSGLAASTTYYVRSYASNSAGTAYGSELSFTTTAAPVNVYVAGTEKNAANKYVAKIWKNGVPTSLTNGNFDAQAKSVFVSGIDVYVCGFEVNAAGFFVAKYWKNGVPTVLTSGTGHGEATSIFVSGTDVYVAITEGPGTSRIARYWKNGVVTTLSNLSNSGYATCIFVSGGNVYVSGAETNASGRYVAKLWTNGIAADLSDGTTHAEAWSVYLLGADIYVTGQISDASPSTVHYAKYWKNGVRTDLVNGTDCDGLSIFATATDVYVAGTKGNLQARIWKNNVLTNLTPGGAFALAHSVYVFGSDVYIAGAENNFAQLWKNGVATSLTDGVRGATGYAVFVTN